MKRKTLLKLALFTLLGFSTAGILVIHFFQRAGIEEIITFGWPWYEQIFAGLVVGTLFGLLAKHIVQSDLLMPVRKEYQRLIGPVDLSHLDIILVSLCAGIGEELFFRAGLQPLLGIWFTSIGFVALHGYLSPNNYRLTVYGVCLTVMIAGIGLLFDRTGILSAMTAHAVIDIILLEMMVIPPRID